MLRTTPVLPITKFTPTNYDLPTTSVAEVNVNTGIDISALEFIVVMYNVNIIIRVNINDANLPP